MNTLKKLTVLTLVTGTLLTNVATAIDYSALDAMRESGMSSYINKYGLDDGPKRWKMDMTKLKNKLKKPVLSKQCYTDVDHYAKTIHKTYAYTVGCITDMQLYGKIALYGEVGMCEAYFKQDEVEKKYKCNKADNMILSKQDLAKYKEATQYIKLRTKNLNKIAEMAE